MIILIVCLAKLGFYVFKGKFRTYQFRINSFFIEFQHLAAKPFQYQSKKSPSHPQKT